MSHVVCGELELAVSYFSVLINANGKYKHIPITD